MWTMEVADLGFQRRCFELRSYTSQSELEMNLCFDVRVVLAL
jgi:hypothetical protein